MFFEFFQFFGTFYVVCIPGTVWAVPNFERRAWDLWDGRSDVAGQACDSLWTTALDGCISNSKH